MNYISNSDKMPDISLDSVIITVDRDLVEQVWINLLHNSIKFTPQGGTIRVRTTETDDHHATVLISDTGIGMSEETRMHVFERFYKADQSRNRDAEGNGLGLPIVKKIIDLHKGGIQVQSQLGEGTEVRVIFDLAQSNESG